MPAGRSQAASAQRRSAWSRVQGWLWQCRRGWRVSLRDLRRRPAGNLLTCLVIGAALALPGGAHVLLQNMERLFSDWGDSFEISLFLRQDLEPGQDRQLLERLAREHPDLRFTLVSPDAALREFRALAGIGDAVDLLEENPLPAMLEARPHGEQWAARRYREVLQRFQALPEVKYARYEQDLLGLLEHVHELLRRLAALLLGLFSMAVFLVIGNTIRLGVYARREELEITLLFGAGGAFLRRPFVYTGLLYGLLGGLIAWAVVNGLTALLQEPIVELADDLHVTDFQLRGMGLGEGAGIILLGALLGTVAAVLSVHRHVREMEKQL